MADVAAEQASSGHQPEKRKRGRPRKLKTDQSEEPKPKRARGRPKGSKNKKPSKFQEILRPVKYKALLKFKKNKTNSQNSQHKQLKRITENLQAKPAQPENVQTNSSRNLCRINGKFASSKNNSLKNMKNSVTPQISSKYKVDGRSSVISNHSKKRTGPANSKRVKTAVNSKRQTRKKYYSTKKNSNSIQSPNNNQRKRIQSSPKNPTLVNQLQSPVNYRRKSCGLCDQTSVRRHRVTSPKHFCKDLLSSNCRQSSSSLRRSRRIMSICNKFSNSTTGSENTSPSSSVYYSSPEFLMPLRKRRNSRRAHSPHTLLHNVSRLCSSHHHSHATVNNTTSPSSHTTGTTITTTTTTALSCPTTAPLSSTASSSTLSPVSAASTNNLHHPSSFSSQSTPNDSLSEHQTDSFTSTSQPKDVTNAVHIVRSCSQLSPNNCSLKMLKCHRLHHLAAASGDVAAASVVSRHCTATKHLNGKCHAMHMNTQPCLPNISSAVQVAASMISSRISDKSVSIYNHALEKQSGSVCQSYEQLNIVLSPFEKQIFELHRQEHEQRMAMEEERHQMKMNIMRLKKKALERKLKN